MKSRVRSISILIFLILLVKPGLAQERSLDYQYALIEAVKQKNLGNLSEAVKLYSLVIKEEPECDVAYYELGSIYLMTNQVSLAIQNLEKAYEMKSGNKWYVLAYLHALGMAERYDDMEFILKRQVEESQEEWEWDLQLAEVYYNQGKSKKAIRTLEAVEKERGVSKRVALLKAMVYEREVDTENLRIELEKVLRIDSTDISALGKLADYHWNKGEYEKSISYIEKSFYSPQINKDHKVASLSFVLSEESIGEKYPKEISRAIETLLRIHPDAWEGRLLAAEIYLQIQDYERSYHHLKAFIIGREANYPAYMQAVLLANASSLEEELIWVTEEALQRFPDSTDIRLFRGIALYELKDYEGLVNNFKDIDYETFSRKEYISQSRMMYAEGLYRINEFVSSDSAFEALIRDEPHNYMVLNNYSYYLAERGEKLDQAEVWSNTAIVNNPENATFLDTHAWVLYKKGNLTGAEEVILRALNHGGDNDPEVNEHAGDIQAALGSTGLAIGYYNKAIILGGDKEKLERKIKLLQDESSR